jgi:hypothetical protein
VVSIDGVAARVPGLVGDLSGLLGSVAFYFYFYFYFHFHSYF